MSLKPFKYSAGAYWCISNLPLLWGWKNPLACCTIHSVIMFLEQTSSPLHKQLGLLLYTSMSRLHRHNLPEITVSDTIRDSCCGLQNTCIYVLKWKTWSPWDTWHGIVMEHVPCVSGFKHCNALCSLSHILSPSPSLWSALWASSWTKLCNSFFLPWIPIEKNRTWNSLLLSTTHMKNLYLHSFS